MSTQTNAIEVKSTAEHASKNISMLIYGPSGFGKTTLAGTLTGKTLIISAEGGLLSLHNKEIDFIAEKFASQKEELTVRKGIWIGFFQVLALLPGMSRSGATISGGLLFGLTREKAARFSFLLSFPIIFGSGFKKLLELSGSGALSDIGTSLFWGAITAFIVGLFVIHYLLKYLRNHTLNIFIIKLSIFNIEFIHTKEDG